MALVATEMACGARIASHARGTRLGGSESEVFSLLCVLSVGGHIFEMWRRDKLRGVQNIYIYRLQLLTLKAAIKGMSPVPSNSWEAAERAGVDT